MASEFEPETLETTWKFFYDTVRNSARPENYSSYMFTTSINLYELEDNFSPGSDLILPGDNLHLKAIQYR